MLKRTHLSISMASLLYFAPYMAHQIIFSGILLAATMIPDIDHGFSSLGRRKIFRPVQWMTVHRGFLHSYTCCILMSVIVMLFWPIAALPFFLGYSFHLFADSFTQDGIQPFWPHKKKSSGPIRAGGFTEKIVFIVFIGLDILLAIIAYNKMF